MTLTSANLGPELDRLKVTDPDLRAALAEFADDRNDRKIPLTARALMIVINKINGLHPKAAIAAIHRSIENGWRGVFLDKTDAASSDTLFSQMPENPVQKRLSAQIADARRSGRPEVAQRLQSLADDALGEPERDPNFWAGMTDAEFKAALEKVWGEYVLWRNHQVSPFSALAEKFRQTLRICQELRQEADHGRWKKPEAP